MYDAILDTGTYSVKGGELTFETGRDCDIIQAGPATYAWTFVDDVLTFTPVTEDRCAVRAEVYATPWHRQP